MKPKIKRVVVLATLGLVIVGASIFVFFFLRFVSVPTGAMSNTILPGDRLLVSRWVGQIERGDMIIFRYPLEPAVTYVSRVIALGGETIQIVGTRVRVNGVELNEEIAFSEEDGSGVLRETSTQGTGDYRVFYRAEPEQETTLSFLRASMTYGVEPFDVPAGHYFVMGDNRDNSQDSRFWGTVAEDLIIGRPILIYWSVDLYGKTAGTVRWDRIPSKLN